jgi:hypothetical protein
MTTLQPLALPIVYARAFRFLPKMAMSQYQSSVVSMRQV